MCSFNSKTNKQQQTNESEGIQKPPLELKAHISANNVSIESEAEEPPFFLFLILDISSQNNLDYSHTQQQHCSTNTS